MGTPQYPYPYRYPPSPSYCHPSRESGAAQHLPFRRARFPCGVLDGRGRRDGSATDPLSPAGRPLHRENEVLLDHVPLQQHQASRLKAARIPTMAGPGPSKGGHPLHIHPPARIYRLTGTLLGASMWFFLFYRAKKDGPVLLGWKHPFDH